MNGNDKTPPNEIPTRPNPGDTEPNKSGGQHPKDAPPPIKEPSEDADNPNQPPLEREF